MSDSRPASSPPRCILLDIEGTIAPVSFVHEVLFPFARSRVASYLTAHWEEPALREVRTQIERDANATALERPAMVDHLLGLMDRDAKATGLKALQGLIWEGGYRDGSLRSPLFPDVPPALRRWHAAGINLRIYSSGSIAAQKLFLSNTEHGDLTPLLSGYYDTTIGPKREAESYRRIAKAIARDPNITAIGRQTEIPAGSILFISDIVEELNAAAAAGMQTRLALRPGNAPVAPHAHTAIPTFDSLFSA